MKALSENQWHNKDLEAVIKAFQTETKTGLSTEAVKKRQTSFGRNVLSRQTGHGPLIRFLLQFHQPLVYILLAATLLTLLLEEWIDAIVIFGVIFINAAISYVQEAKAIKAIDALSKAMVSEATVLRNGERRRVSSAELVPGDIVLLQSGDKIPADLRLFGVRELQVDESALTGESVPVYKEDIVMEADTVIADRRNMGFSSTFVTHGTARGVVVATGDHSEIGRINALISAAEILETPLTRKIDSFSRILLYVILGMAALTFVLGLFRGQNMVEMFLAAVALAVGAIPEGLPAAITITLAIGVSRMAKKNAIIRKLPAVETLGSTTVICSDKTGTLTQNQMTVRDIYAAGFHYQIEGIGYRPEGIIQPDENSPAPDSNQALRELLTAGALCNEATLQHSEERWTIEGDPTEGALLVSARKAGLDPGKLEQQLPRIDTIPFESAYQYMATLHDPGEGKPKIIYVKGSIESLCLDCSLMLNAEGNPDISSRDEIHAWVERLADQGLRVLAFSRKEVPADTVSITHEDIADGMEFLGLQGMIDPPREEALEAIEASHNAGILVKMITGDHAGTAAAIARQLGLCGESCSYHTREVLTGKDVAALPENQLIEQVEHTAVFARVSPEQKLHFVKALQQKNHIVAMTGDGVNDAPALRQANIGIAMGITGTEVSKEAADMILTDDNFATIRAAIEEGRGIFDNLIKFITWTLPTNGGEGLVILTAILLGTALPILPLQILWINMTTALLLGLMLAVEPKEPGLMQRTPRDTREPILTRPLVFRIVLVSFLMLLGAFGLFQWVLSWSDGDMAQARTVAVNVFVFGEMFYLFNCRSMTRPMWRLGLFSNKWLLGGVALMALLQMVYTYTPLFHTIFDSRPMNMTEWALVIGNSTLIYLVVELEKYITNSSKR
jgi:Ca2+-transporting ATPase